MSHRYQHLKYFFTEDFTDFKITDVANYVLEHHQEKGLVDLALNEDKKISSRASWVIWHCSDLEYERISPYHTILIKNLKKSIYTMDLNVVCYTCFKTIQYQKNTKHFC